jgi:hypothetical protein
MATEVVRFASTRAKPSVHGEKRRGTYITRPVAKPAAPAPAPAAAAAPAAKQ